MGARGWTLYREVVVPAALPGFMAGLQQAWGFAWKALMAAELIITAVGATGLGHLLAERAERRAGAARRARRDRGHRRGGGLPGVQPARPAGASAEGCWSRAEPAPDVWRARLSVRSGTRMRTCVVVLADLPVAHLRRGLQDVHALDAPGSSWPPLPAAWCAASRHDSSRHPDQIDRLDDRHHSPTSTRCVAVTLVDTPHHLLHVAAATPPRTGTDPSRAPFTRTRTGPPGS